MEVRLLKFGRFGPVLSALADRSRSMVHTDAEQTAQVTMAVKEQKLTRGRLIPTGTHHRETSSLKRPWATAVISLFSFSLLDALARGFL